MMTDILVTGSNGQLGQSLQKAVAAYPQLKFHFLTRNEIDICDQEQLASLIKKISPSFIINCAAYTAVDKAESDKEMAYAINAGAVRNLALVANSNNIKLIHISTDYVFDGRATRPYLETDATNPQNVYGATKEAGEKFCLEFCPSAIIVRVSWLFSEFGNNFVKTMIRLMKERKELNIVHDQAGCPTYAVDLADALCRIISSGKWAAGIYHFSNEGVTTWYLFAEKIRELIQSDCRLSPITTEQYPTPAKRPAYSVLDHSKIKSTFALSIPRWEESLAKCISAIQG